MLSRERFERFIEAMSGRVALKGRVSWVMEEQGGDGSGVGGVGGDDGGGGGGGYGSDDGEGGTGHGWDLPSSGSDGEGGTTEAAVAAEAAARAEAGTLEAELRVARRAIVAREAALHRQKEDTRSLSSLTDTQVIVI